LEENEVPQWLLTHEELKFLDAKSPKKKRKASSTPKSSQKKRTDTPESKRGRKRKSLSKKERQVLELSDFEESEIEVFRKQIPRLRQMIELNEPDTWEPANTHDLREELEELEELEEGSEADEQEERKERSVSVNIPKNVRLRQSLRFPPPSLFFRMCKKNHFLTHKSSNGRAMDLEPAPYKEKHNHSRGCISSIRIIF